MKKLLVPALMLAPFAARATTPTDIDGVVTAVAATFAAALVVGIGVLLWVKGRKVFNKAI